jgi:branched-chain amino acid transport system substrate-binding protein
MGRDAAELEADLVFAAGETLRMPPGDLPLAAGTLMIAPPEWTQTSDPVANAAFAERRVLVVGYVLPAYAAVEVARQALMQQASPEAVLTGDLSGREFSTVIGPVAFDAKGDLAENPYRLFRFDGTDFKPTVYP